jgi:hypothetical protein
MVDYPSNREAQTGRLARYRRVRNYKVAKTIGPSASESALAEQLRQTSISGQPANAPAGVIYQQPQLQLQPFQPRYPVPSVSAAAQGPYVPHGLPFEPVYRAGILIIITAPDGNVSLGMCDGERRARGYLPPFLNFGRY